MITLRLVVAALVVGAVWSGFGRLAREGTSRALPSAAVATMNWMRGLAAVCVLLGHVRGLYMKDYESVATPTVLWKAFYVVSGLGHQAVVVFFILSGFLVGWTVLAQGAEGRWSFRDYLTRRIVRLGVVLVPGLLLTAAWDLAGLSLFGADGIYGGHLQARYLTMPDVRVTLSLAHFVGNLVFLQHIFIAPFGTNTPLWSLSYEFWAYLLFPLLVRAGVRTEPTHRRIGYLLLAFVILCGGGLKLALYFSVWSIGAGLALWWRRAAPTESGRAMRSLAWLAFAGCIVLGRADKLGDWYADPLLGIATAVLLGLLLRAPSRSSTSGASWLERGGAQLASFSYTLYVAHYPVIAFFFAAFMGGERWAPTLQSTLWVGAICVAVSLVYAYPLALVTEAHTDALRRRLSRRRSGPVAAAPSAGG